jgi:hypothetical protein
MQPKLAIAPTAPTTAELSEEQLEIIGQFNDLAYEHPNRSFYELMQRVCMKFADGPSFNVFVAACREIFDRERL